MALVLPSPMALLVYRHGAGAGLMAWAVAGVLSGVLLGGVQAVLLLIPMGLTGLGLGLALHARLAPGRVLLAGVAGALLASLFSIGVSLWVMGINPFDQMLRLYEESMKGAINLYRQLGVPAEQLDLLDQQLKLTMQALPRILPAIFLSGAVFIAFASYWAVRVVLRRMGETLPWFEPFSRWRPTPLSAVALFAGLLLLMLQGGPSWVATAGASLAVLGAGVALVSGLSLLWFWYEQARVSRGMRVLITALLLWPSLTWGYLLLLGAGLADAWFNFRRL